MRTKLNNKNCLRIMMSLLPCIKLPFVVYWAVFRVRSPSLSANAEMRHFYFIVGKYLILGDTDKEHRTRVKELTQELLHKAEWIYRHHLVCQDKTVTVNYHSVYKISSNAKIMDNCFFFFYMQPKSRVPWRSRSQLNRYRVLSVLSNNLLVHDVTENTFVVIKVRKLSTT